MISFSSVSRGPLQNDSTTMGLFNNFNSLFPVSYSREIQTIESRLFDLFAQLPSFFVNNIIRSCHVTLGSRSETTKLACFLLSLSLSLKHKPTAYTTELTTFSQEQERRHRSNDEEHEQQYPHAVQHLQCLLHSGKGAYHT